MLLWRLEWGPQLETLREIERTTGMTPSGLASMPETRPDCIGYLNAFFTLSQARLVFEGIPQPIQVSEVGSYLSQFLGISSGDERVKALTLLQGMDEVYLDFRMKKIEESRKK